MTDPFQFASGDALLVVDVINDFDHEDGDQLLGSFRERQEAMKRTLAEARSAGIPVLYVNDARGRWDSDAPRLVRDAVEHGRGGELVDQLAPHERESFLLKQRYSAFDHTPLTLLLDQLAVERIVLIGAATEGCVVQTAIDARERQLKATIVADACATTAGELEEIALRYAERVGGVRVAQIGRAVSR
jgi:nicotinamidase-related amidase